MLDNRHVTASEQHRPMHEDTEAYPTASDAMEAMRVMSARPGWRRIAWACAICRGWHLDLVVSRE